MKRLLISLILIVGALVAVYMLFARPFISKKSKVEKALQENLDKVKRFYSSPEGPPSPEVIRALQKGDEILKEEYTKVRKALYHESTIELPKGENPALYFMQKRYEKKKEWDEYAQLKGAKLPGKITGLPEGLPSEGNVPKLLEKLNIGDWAIRMFLDNNIKNISSIYIYDTEDSDIYQKIPLTISFSCDLLSFTKLLYSLENSKEKFVVIDDVSIKSKQIIKEISIGRPEGPPEISQMGAPFHFPGKTSVVEEKTIKKKQTVKKILDVTMSFSILEWSKI